jgi:sRNA-binding protein
MPDYSNRTPEEKAARFERLPVWAKQEITRLRREADYHRADAAALRLGAYGTADTDTVADPYADEPLRLAKGTSIEFRLGDAHEDVIRVRVTKDGLDVNGNGGIHVYPRAGNSIVIRGGRL